jgi:hypothetical protein
VPNDAEFNHMYSFSVLVIKIKPCIYGVINDEFSEWCCAGRWPIQSDSCVIILGFYVCAFRVMCPDYVQC